MPEMNAEIKRQKKNKRQPRLLLDQSMKFGFVQEIVGESN